MTHGSASPTLPRARTEQLVMTDLDAEVLVYDLRSHHAHALNATAALVWRHCDGQTTVAQMAALLPGVTGGAAGEALVWVALHHLEKAGLLSEPLPASAPTAQYSRKDLLKVAGAVALPTVASIVAPLAANAASCSDLGGPCKLNAVPPVTCCSPNHCSKTSGAGTCVA